MYEKNIIADDLCMSFHNHTHTTRKIYQHVITEPYNTHTHTHTHTYTHTHTHTFWLNAHCWWHHVKDFPPEAGLRTWILKGPHTHLRWKMYFDNLWDIWDRSSHTTNWQYQFYLLLIIIIAALYRRLLLFQSYLWCSLLRGYTPVCLGLVFLTSLSLKTWHSSSSVVA